jgi:tetratricopeptide (TPR) repeat protein
LHAGETQGVRALPGLLELAASPAAPAIVRATAATLAQRHASPGTLPAAYALLQDADPSVRIAALGMIAMADAESRVRSGVPLLSDPVRGVRIEAARLLADIPDDRIPEGKRAARAAALLEYEHALALEADWPAGQVNLGNLRRQQGRSDDAIAAFERAIALDKGLADAYVNLADLLREFGRDPEAEKVLRRGLAGLPRDADLHHALGLLLTRKGDRTGALKEFVEAVRLAPGNARYAYVHAIAVDSAGQREQALALLRSAIKRHPDDLDILGALLSLSRESGDRQAALGYAKQLAELLPGDPGLNRLIAELEAK